MICFNCDYSFTHEGLWGKTLKWLTCCFLFFHFSDLVMLILMFLMLEVYFLTSCLRNRCNRLLNVHQTNMKRILSIHQDWKGLDCWGFSFLKSTLFRSMTSSCSAFLSGEKSSGGNASTGFLLSRLLTAVIVTGFSMFLLRDTACTKK